MDSWTMTRRIAIQRWPAVPATANTIPRYLDPVPVVSVTGHWPRYGLLALLFDMIRGCLRSVILLSKHLHPDHIPDDATFQSQVPLMVLPFAPTDL